MEVSKAAVSAIHGLAYLANADTQEPVDVKEIARELGISHVYLAKIFQRLSHTNLVYSRRGPRGGYIPALPPERINLLEIIEAVDGPISTGRCELGPSGQCPMFGRCKIRRELDEVRKQTRKLYEDITLDTFSEQFSGEEIRSS